MAERLQEAVCMVIQRTVNQIFVMHPLRIEVESMEIKVTKKAAMKQDGLHQVRSTMMELVFKEEIERWMTNVIMMIACLEEVVG